MADLPALCLTHRRFLDGDGDDRIAARYRMDMIDYHLRRDCEIVQGRLICICQMSEGFHVETDPEEHNSWCAVHDGPYLLIPTGAATDG